MSVFGSWFATLFTDIDFPLKSQILSYIVNKYMKVQELHKIQLCSVVLPRFNVLMLFSSPC